MKSKHFIFREMEERIQDRLFLGKALTSRTDAGALWENYLVEPEKVVIAR